MWPIQSYFVVFIVEYSFPPRLFIKHHVSLNRSNWFTFRNAQVSAPYKLCSSFFIIIKSNLLVNTSFDNFKHLQVLKEPYSLPLQSKNSAPLVRKPTSNNESQPQNSTGWPKTEANRSHPKQLLLKMQWQAVAGVQSKSVRLMQTLQWVLS